MKSAPPDLATPAQPSKDGMTCLGRLNPAEQGRLSGVLASGLKQLHDAWAASAAKREIFWINLWQRATGEGPLQLDQGGELDRWVRAMLSRYYAGGEVELDSYGFIINPVGSKTQPWHIDYSMGYSSLFIPLTQLTTHNATQHALFPRDLSAPALERVAANLDVIDLDALVEEAGEVSVRQLLAPPFSILKMDFGAVHRGVANTGTFERTMFFISVCRRGDVVPLEPVVEVIHQT